MKINNLCDKHQALNRASLLGHKIKKYDVTCNFACVNVSIEKQRCVYLQKKIHMATFLNMIIDQNLWDKSQNFAKGELVSVEGSTDTNIYFVKDGAFKLYIMDEADEHIIRFAYKGDFAISIDSFLSGKPSSLYIEALKKSCVYSISKNKFETMLNANIAYHHEWLAILQSLLIQQFEREVDLHMASPEKRYQRVLQRSPNLFQQIPLKYIANYLRMAPETLSRLRKS